MIKRINGFPIGHKKPILKDVTFQVIEVMQYLCFLDWITKVNPGGNIEIHPYSKGDCMGGGFDHSAMGAMSTCHKWEPWSEGGHRERGHSIS